MVGLTWAQSVNKFFEPTVRIQTDRGHRSSTPVLMPSSGIRDTSLASFLHRHAPVPGFPVGIDPRRFGVPAPGRRTIREDQTLRNELTGYEEYTQRVRYVDSWGVATG